MVRYSGIDPNNLRIIPNLAGLPLPAHHHPPNIIDPQFLKWLLLFVGRIRPGVVRCVWFRDRIPDPTVVLWIIKNRIYLQKIGGNHFTPLFPPTRGGKLKHILWTGKEAKPLPFGGGASGFSVGKHEQMLLFCHAEFNPASRSGKRPNSPGFRIKSGMTVSKRAFADLLTQSTSCNNRDWMRKIPDPPIFHPLKSRKGLWRRGGWPARHREPFRRDGGGIE